MSQNVATSDIAKKQNEEVAQRLLKARQWRWIVAARWQKAQLATVITAPLLALALGSLMPDAKPFISFLAVCFSILDLAFIDRAYKSSLKDAARASEMFDVSVLQLPWHTLVAGKPPTPEETDSAVRAWERLSTKSDIHNWYSPEVDHVPIDLARVICQRMNLTYDKDLRKIYQILIDVLLVVLVLVLFVFGFFTKVPFSEFLINVVVPFAPFMGWALRERFRQADAVKASEPVIQNAENLIDKILLGGGLESCHSGSSRLLQDAIFLRRANTVLLFPGIYKLRRANAERDMKAGARYWVDRATEAVPTP